MPNAGKFYKSNVRKFHFRQINLKKLTIHMKKRIRYNYGQLSKHLHGMLRGFSRRGVKPRGM